MSYNQFLGGIILFSINKYATVVSFSPSLSNGSCCHSLGGIIPLYANANATVSPYIF